MFLLEMKSLSSGDIQFVAPAPRATKYFCLTSEHIWKLFVGTVAKIFLNGASPQGCVSALQFLYITHIPKSDICILRVPSSKILNS